MSQGGEPTDGETAVGIDASVTEAPATVEVFTTDGEISTTASAESDVFTTDGEILTTELVNATSGLMNPTSGGAADTRGGPALGLSTGEVNSSEPTSCLDEEGCPWTSRAAFPRQVRWTVTAAQGSKFYALGGAHRDEPPPDATGEDLYWDAGQRESYVYDATTNQWSALASAPEDVSAGAAGVISGTVYVVRGSGLPLLSYDIAADTWSTGAVPDVELAPCGETSAAVADGKLFVVGQSIPAGNGYATSVHFYQPQAAAWGSIAPLPAPVWSSAVCAMNGRIYSFGSGNTTAPREDTGDGSLERIEGTDKTWIYDMAAGSWSAGSAESPKRGRHFCAAIGDVIYVAGGQAEDGWLETLRRYDPATDTWEDASPIPGQIFPHRPQVVDGQLYALSDAPALGANALWRFTPTP